MSVPLHLSRSVFLCHRVNYENWHIKRFKLNSFISDGVSDPPALSKRQAIESHYKPNKFHGKHSCLRSSISGSSSCSSCSCFSFSISISFSFLLELWQINLAILHTHTHIHTLTHNGTFSRASFPPCFLSVFVKCSRLARGLSNNQRIDSTQHDDSQAAYQ